MHLAGSWYESYGVEENPLVDWQTKFGESPECKSYAKAFEAKAWAEGQYTVSNCGSITTVIQGDFNADTDSPWPIPPGVNQFIDEEGSFTCCGNCSLKIPEVRLFYFPDETNADCQNNQTSNLTSVTSTPIQKRVHSLVANGSTAVISGYTL